MALHDQLERLLREAEGSGDTPFSVIDVKSVETGDVLRCTTDGKRRPCIYAVRKHMRRGGDVPARSNAYLRCSPARRHCPEGCLRHLLSKAAKIAYAFEGHEIYITVFESYEKDDARAAEIRKLYGASRTFSCPIGHGRERWIFTPGPARDADRIAESEVAEKIVEALLRSPAAGKRSKIFVPRVDLPAEDDEPAHSANEHVRAADGWKGEFDIPTGVPNHQLDHEMDQVVWRVSQRKLVWSHVPISEAALSSTSADLTPREDDAIGEAFTKYEGMSALRRTGKRRMYRDFAHAIEEWALDEWEAA
jgi:hypothetical protein